MRLSRLLLVPAILLMATSVARANDIQVVSDPPFPTPPFGFEYVLKTQGPFSVSWGSCNQSVNPAIPDALTGFAACLPFLNETNGPITQVHIDFTVASGSPLIGQTVSCVTVPGDLFFATNNCAAAGTLFAGEEVELTFSGLPIPNGMAFFFAESATQIPDPTFTVPTHDPGTLILLATGIGLMGLCGIRQRA